MRRILVIAAMFFLFGFHAAGAQSDGNGPLCYDITNDSKVNILDLAAVGSKVGTANVISDLTYDGIVDVADLVLVSGNFGASTQAIYPGCALDQKITSRCTCSGKSYITGYCCSSGYSDAACSALPLSASASPQSTTFASSITVTLSSSDPAASIYYTTDGSTPTASSGVYSSALTFTNTTTLKFFAKNQSSQTSTASETYTKSSGTLQAVITIDEPDFYKSGSYFPDYGMSLKKGFVPFPVFFEGWQSSPRDEIIDYEWDFGQGTENDEGGRYFHGFNAAHVYETPGTYNVILTIENSSGTMQSATAQINVMDINGTTFYFDSTIGNDTAYDGKCPVVQGTCGPWKTATKAFSLMRRPTQWAALKDWYYKPGDRILFKRGQTFELSGSVNLGHGYGTQGYYFGACDEECGNPNDPKPYIQYTGTTGDKILGTGYGTGYIGFVDLQFNFLGDIHQSSGLINAPSGWKNILFLRSDFYEPTNSIWFFHGYDLTNEPSGIFMVGNTINQTKTAATAVIQFYGGAPRICVVGKTLYHFN